MPLMRIATVKASASREMRDEVHLISRCCEYGNTERKIKVSQENAFRRKQATQYRIGWVAGVSEVSPFVVWSTAVARK